MTGQSLSAHVVVDRPDAFRLDVRLDVAPGEVVAVMGPSGAGKSTLLAAIAGLVRLTAGSISIGGAEVASVRPDRRGAVLLGQEPQLFPHLTVRANVAFGLRAHGMPRAQADGLADEWLTRVGLDGFGPRRPAELSGGQQQRVAVARALAIDPHVLLLDEPLTSLDPETAGDIRAMLAQQLVETGATAVVVTHDVVDAAAIAARLVVVEDGAVTQEGPVREVLAVPHTRFVAAVVGVNRVTGVAAAGEWTSSDGALAVPAPAFAENTPLAAVFRPAVVRLDPASVDRPPASPGQWLARVIRLEQTPGGVRVHTGAPAVAVDISVEDAAALRLAPGAPVRLAVDPAHVRLQHLGVDEAVA